MRQADIVFALCLLVLAGLVAWESLALSIGCASMAQRAGFSFWLAVGLGLPGLVILGQALWHAAPTLHKPPRSARWVGTAVDGRHPSHRHGRSLCMHCLLPATALYLAFYMRWVGQHRWPLVLAVSICLPLGSYFLFDKWFLIPMPKGLWGEHLGL